MLTLSASNIVVGGTLEALKFADKNNYHVVYCNPQPPHPLEETDDTRLAWLNLCFSLSLRGLIIAPEITSIRLLEGSLRLVARNFFVNVQFDKLFIFSDENLTGLPEPTGRTDDTYKVLDWITMGDGMSHQHDKLEDGGDFVNHIIFYPTDRLDGHHPDKKDAVAVSFMKEDNLHDVLWSDSYARLKAIRMMKDAGISFSDTKIETSHREIIHQGKFIYPKINNVEFR